MAVEEGWWWWWYALDREEGRLRLRRGRLDSQGGMRSLNYLEPGDRRS